MICEAFLQCISARLVLGNAVLVALFSFYQAVRDRCGTGTARMFLIVTLTQFHLMFYMSRTLPNIFALILGKHRMLNITPKMQFTVKLCL